MSDIAESIRVKGGLSTEIVSSEFFRWWLTIPDSQTRGWLGFNGRTDARDRIYEAYLKSKAVGPNGIAFAMASSPFHLCDLNIGLRDFYQILKDTYAKPLENIIDLLKQTGIPVKHITDKITGEHIEQTEEGIKILVRIKQGGHRTPKSFEGEYHDVSPGHSKFWTLTYIGGDKPFRATWGKISGQSQGHKDYTDQEAAELAREKTIHGNYVKQ